MEDKVKLDWGLFGLGVSFIAGAIMVLLYLLFGLPTDFGIALPVLYGAFLVLYYGHQMNKEVKK